MPGPDTRGSNAGDGKKFSLGAGAYESPIQLQQLPREFLTVCNFSRCVQPSGVVRNYTAITHSTARGFDITESSRLQNYRQQSQ